MQPPAEDDAAIMHNAQRIKVIKRLNRFCHFLQAKLPELSVKTVELFDRDGTVIIFDNFKAVQEPDMLLPSMMEFRRVYFLKDFHNICRNQELVCILCLCCIVPLIKKCHIITIFEGNCFKNASTFDGLPECLRLTVIHRKKPFLHTFFLEQAIRTSFCEHHRGEQFPFLLPEHRKELPGQIRIDSDFLRKVSQIFLSINRIKHFPKRLSVSRAEILNTQCLFKLFCALLSSLCNASDRIFRPALRLRHSRHIYRGIQPCRYLSLRQGWLLPERIQKFFLLYKTKVLIVLHAKAQKLPHLLFKSTLAFFLVKLKDSAAVPSVEGIPFLLAADFLHLDTERGVFIFIRLVGEP